MPAASWRSRVACTSAGNSARSFSDYRVTVDREGLPAGVEVIER